jgi:hypothetical protein
MIINLVVGKFIAPTRVLNNTQVQHWKYAKECANIGGGINSGTLLKIIEVCKVPGNMWVKVELPHTSPPKSIKISGEEFAHNFRSA